MNNNEALRMMGYNDEVEEVDEDEMDAYLVSDEDETDNNYDYHYENTGCRKATYDVDGCDIMEQL